MPTGMCSGSSCVVEAQREGPQKKQLPATRVLGTAAAVWPSGWKLPPPVILRLGGASVTKLLLVMRQHCRRHCLASPEPPLLQCSPRQVKGSERPSPQLQMGRVRLNEVTRR